MILFSDVQRQSRYSERKHAQEICVTHRSVVAFTNAFATSPERRLETLRPACGTSSISTTPRKYNRTCAYPELLHP